MSQVNEATSLRAPQEDEVEIDLLDLFYMLRAHLLQIIAFFILGGVGAGMISYFLIAPTYEATSQLYVAATTSQAQMSLSDLQVGSQLTSDYSVLLSTRTVLDEVITDLGLDMTYEDLSKMVQVNNPSDTRILAITATTTSPELSRDIANQVALVAQEYLPTVMDATTPSIAEQAVLPTRKSAPSNARNAILGALLLGVLCMAYHVVRYLMDDTVSTADDLERYFGLRPLATIPDTAALPDENQKKKNSLFGKKDKQPASAGTGV